MSRGVSEGECWGGALTHCRQESVVCW